MGSFTAIWWPFIDTLVMCYHITMNCSESATPFSCRGSAVSQGSIALTSHTSHLVCVLPVLIKVVVGAVNGSEGPLHQARADVVGLLQVVNQLVVVLSGAHCSAHLAWRTRERRRERGRETEEGRRREREGERRRERGRETEGGRGRETEGGREREGGRGREGDGERGRERERGQGFTLQVSLDNRLNS